MVFCRNTELKTLSAHMAEQQSIREHVEKLIRDDNKEEFVSFLRNDGRHACDLSPSHLLKLICMHRATGCATELLGDKTGFHVDVNEALEGGLLPLQMAAESLSFGLTSILLEYGAQANVYNEQGSMDFSVLPLNKAIQAIRDRFVSDWSPEKPFNKLLHILNLPDLQEPLDTINLLAQRTEDIEKISLYYVEAGEVVQLAALLLGAWKKLMPSNVEDVEKSVVGQHIWRQISDVGDQELQFMLNCGPQCQVLDRLKSKKITLVTELRLLRVLEFARKAYEENPDLFSSETALTPEEPSEDPCMLSEYAEHRQTAQMDEDTDKEMQAWTMQYACKRRDADRSEASQEELFSRSMVSSAAVSPSGGGCCSTLSSASSFSSSRPYHTSGALTIHSGKPFGSPVPRNIQKVVKPQSAVFSSSAKICGRLLLHAKRIVK